MGNVLGVPRIRIIVVGGLYWGMSSFLETTIVPFQLCIRLVSCKAQADHYATRGF